MNTSKVTVEFVTSPKPDVRLTIPYRTAEALMKVCGSITGARGRPGDTIREHTDAVYAALLDAGVKVGERSFTGTFTGEIS